MTALRLKIKKWLWLARGCRGRQGSASLKSPWQNQSPAHRGSPNLSTTLLREELQDTPVNDPSFVQKEQANGDLCCIESVKESALQTSGFWGFLDTSLTQVRVRGGGEREGGRLELSEITLYVCFPQLALPVSPPLQCDRLIFLAHRKHAALLLPTQSFLV